MRWVIRILGRIGVGISFLISVIFLVLWGRSYSGSDLALWTRYWREGDQLRRKYVQVFSRLGRIEVDVSTGQVLGRNSLSWEEFWNESQLSAGRPEFHVARLERQGWEYTDPLHGVAPWSPIRWRKWRHSDSSDVVVEVRVVVVHWLAAMLFLIAPAWRVVVWRRMRKKIRAGLCGNCGYDLRASPERCPECGEVALGAEC